MDETRPLAEYSMQELEKELNYRIPSRRHRLESLDAGIMKTYLGVTNMNELEKLEKKREQLHSYIIFKLDERDYHAVADAAMDLRELEVEIRLKKNNA